jgi:hypothetical protein
MGAAPTETPPNGDHRRFVLYSSLEEKKREIQPDPHIGEVSG